MGAAAELGNHSGALVNTVKDRTGALTDEDVLGIAEVLRKGLHQPGRAFSMMYADNQTGMFFMVWDCTHASMGVGALAACGESLRAEGSMVFCVGSSDRGVSTGSIQCYDYPPDGTIAFDSELPPVTGDAGFSATGRPWFLDGAEYGAFWS